MPGALLDRYFRHEHARLKLLSEGNIRSSVLTIGDFLAREQSIGAVDQLNLHKELFGRLLAQVQAEITSKERKLK